MRRLGGPSAFPTFTFTFTFTPTPAPAPTSNKLTPAQPWRCQTRSLRTRWWRANRMGYSGAHFREQVPVYRMSQLVMDLDADGREGVRPWDPDLDGEPEDESAYRESELQPIQSRVTEFEEQYEECEARHRHTSYGLHPMQISHHDVLAATLFDPPTALDSESQSLLSNVAHASHLRRVLEANGIPPSFLKDPSPKDPSPTLKLMQNRIDEYRAGKRERARVYPMLLALALRRCESFTDIERLVAKALREPMGRRTVPKLSSELYRALTRVPEADPIQLLSFLNSLLINFDRRGLQLSTGFYKLGIRASLQCQAIVTTHQYIERMLEQDDYDESTSASILDEILRNSIGPSSFPRCELQLNAIHRLPALFSLLTGFETGSDRRAFSLRSRISRKDPNTFRLYIRCLARLGAFRTIWHEWHEKDSGPQSSKVDTKSRSGFTDTAYFVTAMMDSLYANERIKDLARSPLFETVTGQLETDWQLDLIAISRSAEILALPEKKREETRVRTPTEVSQWAQLQEIFNEGQIEKAWPALQRFLIEVKIDQ